MAQITYFLPLVFSTAGIPFVFVRNDYGMILIRHGRCLTVLPCGDPAFCEGKSALYGTGKREVMIYNRNGRIVASLLPEENHLIIKHEGMVDVIRLNKVIFDMGNFTLKPGSFPFIEDMTAIYKESARKSREIARFVEQEAAEGDLDDEDILSSDEDDVH